MNAFIRRRLLKSGDYHYYVIAVVNGRQRSFGGFGKKKLAESRLRKVQEKIAAGALDMPEMIFAEFANKWLNDFARGNVSERTANDYSTIIRRHLNPAFSDKKISEIEPLDVQLYLADKGRLDLSPATINKSLVILKAILSKALEWGYIRKDPARYIKRLREPRKEMAFLAPDEIRRFLEAAKPEDQLMLTTAVFTGLRQAELLALRWSSIDLIKGLIYVTRTYHPIYGFGEPKSETSRRAVYMPPELIEMFRKQTGDPDQLVFPDGNGDPIHPSFLLRHQFYPTLERAGLRQIRFHDLRHTYATLMISIGASITLIQQQMGHSTSRFTLDHYGHLQPSASEGVGARLEALVYDRNVLPFPASRRD